LCFALIRWGALQVLFYFIFCNEPIGLANHSKKMKLFKLPKREGSILKYRVPHLWPRWKEDNICQSIWDKKWVGVGNSLGTCQELGNSLLWAPPPQNRKKEENSSPA
jgi:hypothetical protein